MAAELTPQALACRLDDGACEISENDGLFSLIGAEGSLETATDVASNHHQCLAAARCGLGECPVTPVSADDAFEVPKKA